MVSEEEYILHTFQESFQSKKHARICLYGTGRHTWELIRQLGNYNIIGVIDFSYNGTGHDLLTAKEAQDKADFIVIIARPMLLKKVYAKLQTQMPNVPVYTIEGIELSQVFQTSGIEDKLIKMKNQVASDQDRHVYNRFVHKIQDIPRQADGKIVLADMYTFTNIFLAPFYVNLFLWVMKQAEKQKCDLLLFQARDGYLFYQMYLEEVTHTKRNLPNAKYFYASRQAVIAAVNDPEAGKNYRQYLKSLSLNEYERIGIYDFGARGTVQYYLEQIMQKKLFGLYYMKLPLETGNITTDSYCGREMNFYQMKTFAQVFYPLLEALFEAPHGSLKGFDHEGIPILEEYIGNENTKKVIYAAVMDYYREYRSFCGEENTPLVSARLLDTCMDMLREPQIIFAEEVKRAFVLQDSFQKETLNFADDILI